MRKSTLALSLILLAACRNEPETAPAPAQPSAANGSQVAAGPPVDLSNTKVNEVITPETLFLERAQLGSHVAPDGTVAIATQTFPRGEVPRLTLWFKQSPSGLQTSAKWYDAKQKLIAEDRKEMNGAKVVTFALEKKVAPGKYKVEGYWGGNIAAEYEFEVTK